MIPLFSQNDYDSAKPDDKLLCKCEFCDNTFRAQKRHIKHELKTKKGQVRFCSLKCSSKYFHGEPIIVTCKNCNKIFSKQLCRIKSSPNHFCSKSCAATYNNKNKKTGTRRSKLEKYIEEQLTISYPKLNIEFNKKDTIGSELDIYIPSLKLAFELNGIFHYEPIYGNEKLNQIQENDKSKTKACLDNHIDLCIIDVSQLKYFKPSNAKKYLDIVVNIINQRTNLLIS
jgi:hypothetical protein